MRILVINGPNLALLGRREPGIYGAETLPQILEKVRQRGRDLGIQIEDFQSDVEGELVQRIGKAYGCYDGLILNPAAYTHTSIALRDALQACAIPCVEVHLSNTHARESFRHVSLTAPACIGQVMGFGMMSYLLALDGLVNFLKTKGGKSSGI